MPDRRAKLLRLLAEIDQGIREAETLASDASLSGDDRRFAAAQWEIRRKALERVEGMLRKLNGEK